MAEDVVFRAPPIAPIHKAIQLAASVLGEVVALVDRFSEKLHRWPLLFVGFFDCLCGNVFRSDGLSRQFGQRVALKKPVPQILPVVLLDLVGQFP